ENGTLRLFLRITGERTQTLEASYDSSGQYKAFKKLIQLGAESVLKMNHPPLLGLYYGGIGDFEKTFENSTHS
ncbi:MAG: hypothetical protein ACKPGN_16035, partial [Dolichospermum sp.]